MRNFHCHHCGHLVFFENFKCVNCANSLAYLPDLGDMGSLEPDGENLWRTPANNGEPHSYRLCKNYVETNVCNWAIPVANANPLCRSCRLTSVIPDLSKEGN